MHYKTTFSHNSNKLFDNIILTQNHARYITQSGWNNYLLLVGFGARARPCAACTRLFGFINTPNGALRAPPPRPSQLRYFLFDPQKYLQSIELGPPTSSLSTEPQRLWNMRSPAPAPPIAASLTLPAIFLWSNYVPMRPNALIFSVFPGFSIFFGSFLFVNFFFFFSPFQFLLILLFLSFSSYLFLFFS